ncbi:MAG: winged helix-turn-helix domain-containing protein [Candidatus Kariarchaeaceae archaeon]|jgi:DNA-binding MarR family transcriptional regulator
MSETSSPDLSPEILATLTEESKLSIIMSLYYFNNLNLTQIATFTQKTKPTIYHHIKWLAEHGFIELDQGSITKSGKYYRLTPLSASIFDLTNARERAVPSSSVNAQQIAMVMRTFGTMLKNIAVFNAAYLEQVNDSDFHDSTLFLTNLIVANPEQKRRLESVYDNLVDTIFSIAQENKDIRPEEVNDQTYPQKHFIYLQASPISLMKSALD